MIIIQVRHKENEEGRVYFLQKITPTYKYSIDVEFTENSLEALRFKNRMSAIHFESWLSSELSETGYNFEIIII